MQQAEIPESTLTLFSEGHVSSRSLLHKGCLEMVGNQLLMDNAVNAPLKQSIKLTRIYTFLRITSSVARNDLLRLFRF